MNNREAVPVNDLIELDQTGLDTGEGLERAVRKLFSA
jgi:alanyl-tRNA synthetase